MNTYMQILKEQNHIILQIIGIFSSNFMYYFKYIGRLYEFQ